MTTANPEPARHAIRFVGDAGNYLTLTVHGRNTPGAANYWDGNFLWCTAEVAAGAFRGSADNVLRNEDLARFLARLADVIARPDGGGAATLEAPDGWLVADLARSADGFEVRGTLCDAPAGGNALEFCFAAGAGLPAALAAQVRATLGAFPVVGGSPPPDEPTPP